MSKFQVEMLSELQGTFFAAADRHKGQEGVA
jgi:hypothetical protein